MDVCVLCVVCARASRNDVNSRQRLSKNDDCLASLSLVVFGSCFEYVCGSDSDKQKVM